MRIDLSGRTALVTGSTQGIGRAIATALADAGARVAVNGRNRDTVASVISELQSENPERELIAAPGDVTDFCGHSHLLRPSRRSEAAEVRIGRSFEE